MDLNPIPAIACSTSDQPVSNGQVQGEAENVEEETVQQTRCLTVEPVLFVFMFGLGIFYPAFQGLAYYKVCMEEFNSSFVCNNLHNASNADEEDIVQTRSSHFFLYEQLCFEIPAISLSFLYGALSDHTSRKLTLALPVIGQTFAMLVFMLNAIYIDSDVRYLLLGRTITGIFGGWISCCLASFSYLSAVSTTKSRTTRISLAEGVINMAFASSYFISGVMLDNTSFVFVFGFVTGINVLCLIYIVAWVIEPKRPHKPCGNIQESTTIHESTEKPSLPREILQRVKDAVSCVFRKRENNKRAQLLALLAAVFTGMVSYEAMWILGYLYVKRRPLSWSQTLFGVFVGYSQTLMGIFLLVVVPLLKQKFHFRDTTLILMALFSSVGSEVLYGLSTVTWMVFLVPVIGIMASTKMTCMRSLMSTLVPTQELGQMFAAVGSLQSMSGIAGGLIFNTLYPHTLHFWPGFCFILGATITIFPIGLISWLHRNLKKTEGRYQNIEEDEATETDVIVRRPLMANKSPTELSPVGSEDEELFGVLGIQKTKPRYQLLLDSD